jgi:WD40 repeat protein
MGGCIKTLEGQKSEISSVILYDENKMIASGSYDGIIKLWDIKKEECLRTFKNHTSPIHQINISSDN